MSDLDVGPIDDRAVELPEGRLTGPEAEGDLLQKARILAGTR